MQPPSPPHSPLRLPFRLPFSGFFARRLSTRIVALFLGLLLLVQAAGFGVISATIESSARTTLARELEVGERIWRRLLEQKADALVLGATVLAADYGFREAVATGDVDTLDSVLDNHSARIGAEIGAWVDTGFVVRAVHDGGGAMADTAVLQRVAAELARQPRASQVAVLGGRPFRFVAVPMRAPLPIGWVVMGFPIDRALLDDMRDLSRLHVVLALPGGPGRACRRRCRRCRPTPTPPPAPHWPATANASASPATPWWRAMWRWPPTATPASCCCARWTAWWRRSAACSGRCWRSPCWRWPCSASSASSWRGRSPRRCGRWCARAHSWAAATTASRCNTPTAPTRSAAWPRPSTRCASTSPHTPPRCASSPTGTA